MVQEASLLLILTGLPEELLGVINDAVGGQSRLPSFVL